MPEKRKEQSKSIIIIEGSVGTIFAFIFGYSLLQLFTAGVEEKFAGMIKIEGTFETWVMFIAVMFLIFCIYITFFKEKKEM